MHETIERRVLGGLDTLSAGARYRTYEEYQRDEWASRNVRLLVGRLGVFPQLTVAYPAEEADYPRLSPDQMVFVIRTLPDLRLLKSVMLTDLVDRDEAWARAQAQGTSGPGLLIPTRATISGELLIYRPHDIETLVADVRREWCSLLFFNSRQAASAFAAVGDFELLSEEKDYASNPHTAWVHLGQRLLLEDARIPISSADFWPVRFAILARAIKDQITTVPPELRCGRHNEIVSLCTYLQQRVAEKVVVKLAEHLENAAPDHVAKANGILAYLQSRR